MLTPEGIAQVASYAQGIGPWIPQVIEPGQHDLVPTALTELAHEQNMLVHPYTLRADELPVGVSDTNALHRALFDVAGVDGLFTDFPDLSLRYLQARR